MSATKTAKARAAGHTGSYNVNCEVAVLMFIDDVTVSHIYKTVIECLQLNSL